MQRPVQTLLAWLEREEAVNVLLGHRVPTPGEDVTAHIVNWEAKRAALLARPVFVQRPVVEEIPHELATKNAAFAQRPDVIAGFQGLQWGVRIANLANVLSFQKTVVLEQAEQRVGGITREHWAELFDLCLPPVQPPQEMTGMLDQGGKAVNFSSLNPNLRVTGQGMHEVNVPAGPNQPPVPVKFVGFVIGLGTSFVQVAEYNGRFLLRDGYHRCYALLRKGVDRVPCVVVHAANFAQTGAQQAGFFSYETLFSERPPYLKDFLDPAVSVTAEQRAVRRVIRISAEEFSVEV